jgi:hypothetical protein
MGDFLSNLVDRTLEAAEVVQPRPISRFEPWGADAVAFEAGGHELSPGESPRGTRPPLQSLADHPAQSEPRRNETWPALLIRPPEAYARPATPLEPQPVVPQPPASDGQNAVVGPTPGPEPPASASPPTIRRRRQTVGPSSQPDPDRSGETPMPAAERVTVVHHRSEAEEPSRSTLEPVTRPTVIARSVAPEDGRRPTVERITERVVSERSVSSVGPLPAADGRSEQLTAPQALQLPPASVVAQPGAIRTIEPAPPALPEPKAAPTPEPERTINVTIGRVEVRAVSPPSPQPKRQQSKAPVMSLDEYLRKRSKGGGG